MSLKGCRFLLMCVDPVTGAETPIGRVDNVTLNDSQSTDEGVYIAGTRANPQPTTAAQQANYIEVDGVFYESCTSSTSCTRELGLNGIYCIPGQCDDLLSDTEGQSCFRCNAPISLKGYSVNPDNTLLAMWEGSGTVTSKERTFPGGNNDATWSATVEFTASDTFNELNPCFH